MSFFTELKRRNVFKVGTAYGIVAWLLIQVASILLPTFHAPDWVMQVFTILILLGFPVALLLAWAYELTPGGIRQTQPVQAEGVESLSMRQKIYITIILSMTLVIVYLIIDNYVLNRTPAAGRAPTVTSTGEGTSKQSPAKGQQVAHTVPPNSIAVLPLDNLSSDPEQEYFADGIADELLNTLAGVHNLEVRGRTSSFYFKGRSENLQTISRMLNVKYILEGSVRKAGDAVRISVSLVDGTTGIQKWSHIYDRKTGDIFATQREIAVDTARQILPHISPADVPALQWQASVHDLMLLARSYERSALTPRDQDKIINIYQQVLKTDPTSASAHARIGRALLLQGDADAAEKHLQRALVLDPKLAEAHTNMGLLLWSQYRKGAGAEFKRAVKLNPNDSEALNQYGHYLLFQFKLVSGIRYLQRAYELDPMNLVYIGDIGYQAALDCDMQTVDQIMAVIEQRFPDAPGRYALSWIADRAGRLDEAIAWSLEALRFKPNYAEAIQELALLYSKLGLTDASRRFQPEPSTRVLLWEHRYTDIISYMKQQDHRAVDADSLGDLGFALQAVGRYSQAVQVFKAIGLPTLATDDELRRFAAVQDLSYMIGALQASGDLDEAKRLAQWLEKFASPDESETPLKKEGWGMYQWRACALAVQGKREQALDNFEKAANRENLSWLPYMRDSSCFRSLQDEPRFRAAISALKARYQALRTKLPETLKGHGLTLEEARMTTQK